MDPTGLAQQADRWEAAPQGAKSEHRIKGSQRSRCPREQPGGWAGPLSWAEGCSPSFAGIGWGVKALTVPLPLGERAGVRGEPECTA